MERLTNRKNEPMIDSQSRIMKSYYKLQELEDIEEELGIELIEFFNVIEKPKVKFYERSFFKYKGKIYTIAEL